MFLPRRIFLFPLMALCCLPLAAGEECQKKCAHSNGWDSAFGAYASVNAPTHELKDALDRRTGYGVGVQWTRDHGDYHASRTRFEFNVFPESNPVGDFQTRTYAKNYSINFDHLFRLNSGPTNVYLVAGLGGIRWSRSDTSTIGSHSLSTSKLDFTAGIGVQIQKHLSLETRYVMSGIDKTFDSNMLQACVGWRY